MLTLLYATIPNIEVRCNTAILKLGILGVTSWLVIILRSIRKGAQAHLEYEKFVPLSALICDAVPRECFAVPWTPGECSSVPATVFFKMMLGRAVKSVALLPPTLLLHHLHVDSQPSVAVRKPVPKSWVICRKMFAASSLATLRHAAPLKLCRKSRLKFNLFCYRPHCHFSFHLFILSQITGLFPALLDEVQLLISLHVKQWFNFFWAYTLPSNSFFMTATYRIIVFIAKPCTV